MASKAELREAVERWQKHCETVQQATVINTAETAKEKMARVKRVRSDYAAFVDYYFPHYTTNPQTGKQTPCAPFHIKAANKVLKERNLKAAFKWHRGAAKSTHLDIFIPLWLKCQETRQLNVMVLVGKSEDNANTLLADIQAELQFNQRYIHDFGQQYNNGFMGGGRICDKGRNGIFRTWTRAVAAWPALQKPPT